MSFILFDVPLLNVSLKNSAWKFLSSPIYLLSSVSGWHLVYWLRSPGSFIQLQTRLGQLAGVIKGDDWVVLFLLNVGFFKSSLGSGDFQSSFLFATDVHTVLMLEDWKQISKKPTVFFSSWNVLSFSISSILTKWKKLSPWKQWCFFLMTCSVVYGGVNKFSPHLFKGKCETAFVDSKEHSPQKWSKFRMLLMWKTSERRICID